MNMLEINSVSSLCAAWDIALKLSPEDAANFIRNKTLKLKSDTELVIESIKRSN